VALVFVVVVAFAILYIWRQKTLNKKDITASLDEHHGHASVNAAEAVDAHDD